MLRPDLRVPEKQKVPRIWRMHWPSAATCSTVPPRWTIRAWEISSKVIGCGRTNRDMLADQQRGSGSCCSAPPCPSRSLVLRRLRGARSAFVRSNTMNLPFGVSMNINNALVLAVTSACRLESYHLRVPHCRCVQRFARNGQDWHHPVLGVALMSSTGLSRKC